MAYDPNQPRVPGGTPEGGEWTDDPAIIAARKAAGLPELPKKKSSLRGDELRWYQISSEGMTKIAKDWAAKYTLRKLRVFQQFYVDNMAKATNPESYKAFENRWKTVSGAIDIREFK